MTTASWPGPSLHAHPAPWLRLVRRIGSATATQNTPRFVAHSAQVTPSSALIRRVIGRFPPLTWNTSAPETVAPASP